MLKVSELTHPKPSRDKHASLLHGYQYINSWQRILVGKITPKESLRETKDRFTKQYLRAFPHASTPLLKELIWQASQSAQDAWRYARATQLYKERLWYALFPKTHYHVPLESCIIGLQGVVDAVKYYPEEACPVIKKAGLAPAKGVREYHELEAGAFILLWNACKSIPARTAIIEYDNDERYVPLTPFLKDRVLRARDEIELARKKPITQEVLTVKQTLP